MGRINLRLTGGLIIALWSGLAAVTVQAESFACWVSADDGRPGFVLVAARDSASARKIAARASVQVEENEYRPVTAVHECIARHRENFRDAEARARWADFPL